MYLPNPGNDTLTNTGTINFQFGGAGGSRVLTGDLINNGTLNVEYNGYFNKFNATYTNNGVLQIASGGGLELANGGVLTNQSGGTLTGGTFDLGGYLVYADAFVGTNQAELILRGGTIQGSGGGDALQQMSVNGTSGKLRVLGGVGFSTQVSTFTNDGLIELGGRSFHVGLQFSGGHGDFINSSTGQIIGSGTFGSSTAFGSFTNAGLISPGASPGIFQIDDEYTQTATGTLAIGISGNNNSDPQNPQYDVLKVSDIATLAGTLTLGLDGSFTPSFNDVYTVFDALSSTGTFANVANGQRLATTGGQGSFIVNYNNANGNVTLSNFTLSGDYNGDGRVDAADYVAWRKSASPTLAGYNVWRANFGRSTLGSGSGSALPQSAVPEPPFGITAVVGSLMVAIRRPGLGRRHSPSC